MAEETLQDPLQRHPQKGPKLDHSISAAPLRPARFLCVGSEAWVPPTPESGLSTRGEGCAHLPQHTQGRATERHRPRRTPERQPGESRAALQCVWGGGGWQSLEARPEWLSGLPPRGLPAKGRSPREAVTLGRRSRTREWEPAGLSLRTPTPSPSQGTKAGRGRGRKGREGAGLGASEPAPLLPGKPQPWGLGGPRGRPQPLPQACLQLSETGLWGAELWKTGPPSSPHSAAPSAR